MKTKSNNGIYKFRREWPMLLGVLMMRVESGIFTLFIFCCTRNLIRVEALTSTFSDVDLSTCVKLSSCTLQLML